VTAGESAGGRRRADRGGAGLGPGWGRAGAGLGPGWPQQAGLAGVGPGGRRGLVFMISVD